MLSSLLTPARSTPTLSLALLLLRLWFGSTMALAHGWPKLATFSMLSTRFSDPFGLGRPASLGLSIVAELLCASLLVAGFATRPAAAILIVNMLTAFVVSHQMRLTGPGNGELAFLYLGVFVVLLLAGAGRYSVDGLLFGRR